MTDPKSNFYALLGIALVSFVGLLLLTGAVLLALNISLGGYLVPLAAGLTGIVVFFGARVYFPEQTRQMVMRVLLITVVIIIICVVISGLIYDTSWDGQTYQAEAMLQLAQGWNPFYDHAPQDATFTTSISFYPKGAWLNAAALYLATGQVEQGKAFNLMLIIASFCVAVSTLRGLHPRWSLVLSALMALNPVSVYQMFSFYVDGQLASCLVILCCLFILIAKAPNRLLSFTLALVIMLTINLKLTGAIYSVIFVAGYGGWYLMTHKRYRVELAAWAVAGGLVGGLFIGYNPYITQYVHQYLATGNPFYPHNWQSLTVITYNSPSNYLTMGWEGKFLTSIFAQAQASTASTRLKFPFIVSLDELDTFTSPDARAAGFGVLFSGALIIAVGVLIAAVLRYRRAAFTEPVIWLVMGLIVISTRTNAEAWWARYVPQFWMLPLWVSILVLSIETRLHWRYLSYTLLLILGINVLLILIPYVSGTIFQSSQLTQQHTELKASADPIVVDFEFFIATRQRFEDHAIPYIEVDELPCAAEMHHQIVGSQAVICLPSATSAP